jgi:hypothetical protein
MAISVAGYTVRVCGLCLSYTTKLAYTVSYSRVRYPPVLPEMTSVFYNGQVVSAQVQEYTDNNSTLIFIVLTT